jgi:prepilin-type N-terminal cleavage/methylation domain-containing protein
MSTPIRRAVQKGFTLVELLIVVIILAILAAIVIPQFSSATTDTQEAALDSNLGGLRNAIELYKAQHTAYPGAGVSNGNAACTGTKGTATAAGAQAFMDHLLMYTDSAGNACTVGDSTFKYGPYLRKALPNDAISNPAKGSAVGDLTVTATGAAIVPTVTTGGWAYDSKSGQIVMNSTKTDSKSKAYYTH